MQCPSGWFIAVMVSLAVSIRPPSIISPSKLLASILSCAMTLSMRESLMPTGERKRIGTLAIWRQGPCTRQQPPWGFCSCIIGASAGYATDVVTSNVAFTYCSVSTSPVWGATLIFMHSGSLCRTLSDSSPYVKVKASNSMLVISSILGSTDADSRC